MIKTNHLQIIPCELAHLETVLQSKQALAQMLQITIPESWPYFPEALPYSYQLLQADPSLYGWWMYLFIHSADRVLAGSGGFKGKPDEAGMVEIGYEIVPEYQGRGLATEVARGLVTYAFSQPEVRLVQAHTLAEPNASNKVLQKIGMKFAGPIQDPDEGEIWRWAITRAEHSMTQA